MLDDARQVGVDQALEDVVGPVAAVIAQPLVACVHQLRHMLHQRAHNLQQQRQHRMKGSWSERGMTAS
jgi:hypothetical protein